jgi:hypothetical protein
MQSPRQRAKQRSLSQARNSFEQNVARSEQTNQDAIDDILLADNNLRDFLAYLIEPVDSLFESGFGSHPNIVG